MTLSHLGVFRNFLISSLLSFFFSNRYDLGTEVLRQHCAKNDASKAMRDAGLCFSLVFASRSIDFAAESKAQRDFLFQGFELMAGKGADFGKLVKVSGFVGVLILVLVFDGIGMMC